MSNTCWRSRARANKWVWSVHFDQIFARVLLLQHVYLPFRLCNCPRWEDNLRKRSEFILIGLRHTCIYYMLNLYIYIYVYSRTSLSKNLLIVTPILSLLSPMTYWHGHMQNCSASRFFIHITYVYSNSPKKILLIVTPLQDQTW